MSDKIFNTIIQLSGEQSDNDEFISYWNSQIKAMTNNFFCILNFKENNGISKSLSSFNIIFKKAAEIQSYDVPLMEINFLRLGNYKEYKDNMGKDFKNKIKKDQFLVLFMNVDEVNDKIMKEINKFFDKLKKTLDLPDLVLLPFNEKLAGNVYSWIESEFLKSFKIRLMSAFTERFQEFQKFFETAQKTKEMLRNEDKMYEYILQRKKYLSLLATSDSWKEIQDVCNEDLFKIYPLLSKRFAFREANNFRTYSEEDFNKNIQERTVSNLEFQQFLFFFYVRALKQCKEFEKLTNFFMKIFNEMHQYSSNFSSMFHYYCWSYNLSVKMITYFRYLKANLSSVRDKFIISKGEINVLYYTKKILKNYAVCAQIEIPQTNIFILALTYRTEEALTAQLDGVLNNVNEEMDNNQQYLNFVEDIKETFDQKFYNIFLSHRKFLQEYLIVLGGISKLHQELNEKKLLFRVAIESIPLLFVLSRFEDAKSKLIDQSTEIMKKKWSYLYETVCFLTIIFVNCLNKSYENLNLMLRSIDINFSRVKDLIKIVECENENIIYDITSEYLQTFKVKEDASKSEDICNTNFILNKKFSFFFDEELLKKEFIYINLNKEKEKKLIFSIQNMTGLHLTFSGVKLIFEDKGEGKDFEYNIPSHEIKIEKYQEKTPYEIPINFTENFKENNFYLLKEIHFLFSNGIHGIYQIDTKKTKIIFNVKTIDTEIDTEISPSYFEEKPFDEDYKNQFYYNVISSLKTKYSGLPDMTDKKLNIQICKNENIENGDLKIVKNLLSEKISSTFPQADIQTNSIEFPPGSLKDNNLTEIDIPFVIENMNFTMKREQQLKFICSIVQGDKTIYIFTKIFTFNIHHALKFNEKVRLLKNNTILLQTTFKLNSKQKDFCVYLNDEKKTKLNLDMTQSINLVLNVKNLSNDNEILKEISNKGLNFSIEKYMFKAEYPDNYLISLFKKTLGMPYHVFITEEEKEHKIFEEFLLTVRIQKLYAGKCLILLKIKQNENWSILGKSKVIQKIDQEKGELKVDFKLLPLLDGFVKVPEIELMKFDLGKAGENITDIDALMNTSTLVFDNIPEDSVIEGNERIVKINPINSCTLRLNVT